MLRMSVVLLTSSLLLAMAAPAGAQQVTHQGPTPERWYVIGSAGVLLNGTKSGNLSGEIGQGLGRYAQAYVNLTYFDDLMTDATRAQLVTLGSVLTSATATPWSFTGRDRGRAVTAGARVLLPTGSVRPFVGAGAGALNVERTITEQTRGDMSQQVASQFGSLGDTTVNPSDSSATHAIGEVVAGVAVLVGRLHVEGTYRYRRAFHGIDGLHLSQAGVAAGVSF